MKNGDMKQIHPWTSIWTRPRATLRAILNRDPKRWVIPLAVVNGIISSIAWIGFLWTKYPDRLDFHRTVFVIVLLILGAIFGLINLYFGSWLYRLTGSWVKGKGTFTEVKCAIGWSYYPFIIASIFNILSSAFLPRPFIAFIFTLLNLTVLIWGLIIFFKLLGEAHQFSAWKAVLAVLIGVALIFVVVMIILLIIPLLKPLFT